MPRVWGRIRGASEAGTGCVTSRRLGLRLAGAGGDGRRGRWCPAGDGRRVGADLPGASGRRQRLETASAEGEMYGEWGYRYEAATVEGFVQQLAVSYLKNRYWHYVRGEVPAGKDPRGV